MKGSKRKIARKGKVEKGRRREEKKEEARRKKEERKKQEEKKEEGWKKNERIRELFLSCVPRGEHLRERFMYV